MTHQLPEMYVARFAVVAVVATLLAISTLLRFSAYSGLAGARAAMALLGTWLAAVALVMWRLGDVRLMSTGSRSDDLTFPIMITLMASATFVLFVVPFGIRLYQKWLGGQMSEEERAPGRAGFVAWLSPMNLLLAAVVSVSYSVGWHVPVLVPLFVTFGLLLITPLLRTISDTPMEPVAPVRPDPSPGEREKVLSLLEAGKITAEESAELLNALGASARVHTPPVMPISSARRLAVIGAAMVLVGFFLPWFVYSPGAEMSRMIGEMQQGMQSFSQSFNMPHGAMPMPNFNVPNIGKISVAGGDVGKGLGWLILALAATGAFLPFMSGTLDREMMRRGRLLALAVGSVILIWLGSSHIRAIDIGFIVVLAGYILEWVGVWREERPVAAENFATAQPV